MSEVPNLITHNYDPKWGPFHNICTLPAVDAEKMFEKLCRSNHFIRSNYLQKRMRTEQWLVSAKNEKLGSTPLEHPIYFFLGDYRIWATDGGDPMRSAAVRMPLSRFDIETITFTWGDSTINAPHLKDEREPSASDPSLGHIYKIAEIESIINDRGLPTPTRPVGLASFVEVQIWDDEPLSI